jgi:hypothetical protein
MTDGAEGELVAVLRAAGNLKRRLPEEDEFTHPARRP